MLKSRQLQNNKQQQQSFPRNIDSTTSNKHSNLLAITKLAKINIEDNKNNKPIKAETLGK